MKSLKEFILTALTLGTVARLEGQAVGCADTKFPADLSAASALLDSAHAIEDLGAFADPSKPMLFSVFFAAGDSVGHVRALDKQDAAAAVSLANYVRHAPPREFWAVRVRISGGDAPALRLERSQYCPPVHPGEGRIVVGVAVVTSGYSAPTPLPPPNMSAADDTVPVEALISADGQVKGARVLRSSGNAKTDARIVRDLQRQKFTPATLDGQPIEGLFRSFGDSPRP